MCLGQWHRGQVPAATTAVHIELQSREATDTPLMPGRDCPAGLEALVHSFCQIRGGKAELWGKPGHLDTAALGLCHCLVAGRMSHWLQQCRRKPVCPVGPPTSGVAWDQHFVLLLQSYKQPFAFGSCTFTMVSTGRPNPCMFSSLHW